jgi:O-antigen/teichoic acid export membrane protein
VVAFRRFLQRKFVRDALALQVSKLFSVGISFVSSVVIARLMGPSAYGEWALVASFVAIWQSFNLTGIGPSTVTRLSAAVGAQDADESLNLMAFYIKIAALWGITCFTFLALFGTPLASRLYSHEVTLLSLPLLPVTFTIPEPLIGTLAAIYTLVLIPDAIYNLVVIALQSRRSMRIAAVLENVNLIMLAVCVVAALIINPTAIGMLAGRLIYSYTTAFLSLWLYRRERTTGILPYPAFNAIIARARTVPIRPYWRFGFAIALDKNISNFFVQMPLQLVGILAGKEAAGYLQLAFRAMQLPNTLTSAIFDNMQTVVPQAIGRRDYANLWGNFNRVIGVLAVGAVGFYGLLVILILMIGAPVAAFLYGNDWLPAVPLLPVLAVYGAVTMVGGVFGPLYRALRLMRAAILVKIVALIIGIVVAIVLIQQMNALGGAWTVSITFTLSILLTALVTLPVLRQRAAEQLLVSESEIV